MQTMQYKLASYPVKNSFVKHRGFNVLIYLDPVTSKHRFFLGSWELNKGYWIGDREIKKEEAACILTGKKLDSFDRVFIG